MIIFWQNIILRQIFPCNNHPLKAILLNTISTSEQLLLLIFRVSISHCHGHFTLKQLKFPVLNETHTNSCTGPRLNLVSTHKVILHIVKRIYIYISLSLYIYILLYIRMHDA
jgi:hypothetical protein